MDPAGPLALFLGSFLASTLLPGGSEAMLLYAVSTTPENQNSYWLIATIGNSLGGLSSWLLVYPAIDSVLFSGSGRG